MKTELAEKVFNEIKREPVFYRHILKRSNFVGSQGMHIGTMTAYSKHIEVMVDTNNKHVFKKAIERFKVEHKSIIESVYFVKSWDKSCTPYIRFVVKE